MGGKRKRRDGATHRLTEDSTPDRSKRNFSPCRRREENEVGGERNDTLRGLRRGLYKLPSPTAGNQHGVGGEGKKRGDCAGLGVKGGDKPPTPWWIHRQ